MRLGFSSTKKSTGVICVAPPPVEDIDKTNVYTSGSLSN